MPPTAEDPAGRLRGIEAWLARNGFKLTVRFGGDDAVAATYERGRDGYRVKLDLRDEWVAELWPRGCTEPFRRTADVSEVWLEANVR